VSVDTELGVVREIGTELDEERAEVRIEAVEVVDFIGNRPPLE
jgi:hypothetical protein